MEACSLLCKLSASSKASLANLIWSLFLVELQTVDCVSLQLRLKGDFSEAFSGKVSFLELTNARVQVFDRFAKCTTFYLREIILLSILKIFGTITRNICCGVNLHYSYSRMNWTA